MASFENSLKYESEVGMGKVRLVSSGRFPERDAETLDWRGWRGMNANAIYSNLPVYRDCYAVTFEFAKMRSSLPRDTRYTIAQELSRVLVDMMVAIYRANSSRNDKARLIAEMRRQVVIVHHLFYNYTHEIFERTFIADSYSCIEGRGTHYGVEKLAVRGNGFYPDMLTFKKNQAKKLGGVL